MTCKVEGCTAPVRSNGYCQMHYRRVVRHGDAETVLMVKRRFGCIIPGCSRPHLGRGLCATHYQRQRRAQ